MHTLSESLPKSKRHRMSRREAIHILAPAAALSLLQPAIACGTPPALVLKDDSFLDDLERLGCLYFWEQSSSKTGQVLDRALTTLGGSRDSRPASSIAATGFGLAALCIADQRGYLPHNQVLERVRTTLDWHLNQMPEVHGFFYHFNDIDTGKRLWECELSSIDTALLLCGVLTARGYFSDARIQSLATQLYERIDWPWMLNNGDTFSMGWKPESGFLDSRWSHYCELMMLYLLAIGSTTHPIAASHWNAFTRPVVDYAGYHYISGPDPLFTHQYSHAWFDFRGLRDQYANYFENSVTATRAHKSFCLSLPDWFNDSYWGVSASDSAGGYVAWGGPPAMGPLDGSVVPCATAGSLPFLPADCLRVLRNLRAKWGRRAWTRYGFVDAFHPSANWYDTEVVGIDQGITVLMAENLRTGFVWQNFMRNSECQRAMQSVGLKAT